MGLPVNKQVSIIIFRSSGECLQIFSKPCVIQNLATSSALQQHSFGESPEMLRRRFQQLHGLVCPPESGVWLQHLIRQLPDHFGFESGVWQNKVTLNGEYLLNPGVDPAAVLLHYVLLGLHTYRNTLVQAAGL